MEMRDFFVSYTSTDQAWARQIVEVLNAHGHTVHVQMWDIAPGDNFLKKMNDFLDYSMGFIAVVSPRYFESPHCDKEFWAAFKKYSESHGAYRFLSFRVQDAPLPTITQTTVYTDLFNTADVKKTVLHAIAPSSTPYTAPPTAPVINLPPRNDDFWGRTDAMAQLVTAFGESTTVLVKQRIAGLGGVGKTQLAIEYAHRYMNKYTDAIWWVDAEHAHEARSSLLTLAERLNLLPEGKAAAQQWQNTQLRDCLQNWLRTHPNTLLIFDNVETAESIQDLLPTNTGHILLTTRDHNLPILYAKTLDLEIFTQDEARSFIRQFAPHAAPDETALDALIQRLGHLPLALKQAAAYMAHPANHTDCAKYLSLLESKGLRLFTAKTAAPIDYHAIVSTTWQVSINKITEPAKQLLYLCAYLAPDDIPLQFFVRQHEFMPEPLQSQLADTFDLNETITSMTQYALAERNGDVLKVHRLVQDVVRAEAEAYAYDWLTPVFYAMIEELPRDFSTRQAFIYFAQLAPHATTIANHANIYDDYENKERIAELCYLLGWGYDDSAEYNLALEWYKNTLEIQEKILGLEHPHTAATYNNVAGVHYQQGNYPKALECSKQALTIREKVLGIEHPDTAQAYNNIATMYDHQGDYPTALEWYQKALIIREKVLGIEHSDTAITYNNIATVYDNQDDYPTALEWYQKALAIYEKVLGLEHPSTSITYNNIAVVYYKQDNYPKAIEWYQKALAIYEKVLGLEHPSTAITYHNLAFTYTQQSDYPVALELFEKAVAIREKVLGPAHPDTIASHENIKYVQSRM